MRADTALGAARSQDVTSVVESGAAEAGPDEGGRRAALRVCVVGSGTRFLSGISYYTYRLAGALSSSHEVSVVLMRRLIPARLYPGRRRVGAQLSGLAYPDGVPVFDGVDWFWVPSIVRAVRFLRRQRPEVTVFQWWTGAVLHTYLLLALLARAGGSRVVVEFHEVQDVGEVDVPLAGVYVKTVLPLLLRMAHGVVVHSEFDRDEVRRRYGSLGRHVALVPHGPYDGFENDEVQNEGDTSRDGVCNLLWFGVIRPFKGVEDLLAAFEAIPEEEIGRYRLTIAGETWEGWDRPATMVASSRYRDRITFVNRYVTDEEVGRLFGSADAVVLPYHRSSSSGPLHLAMAQGLPVVVTAVGGLVEAAREYAGARFVPPRDPTAIRSALAEMVHLRGSRFADPHSWSRTADRYDNLFSGMIDAATARPKAPAGFRPVRLLDIELSGPIPAVPVDDARGGRYGRARSLVRLHGQPLGAVALELGDTGIGREEHASAIWETLGDEIAAHLAGDGLPVPLRPDQRGVVGGEDAACTRARREWLVDAPQVSVIIPTRERPDLLRRCLESILAGDYPTERVEVLVVDNRPTTDRTRRVVEELATSWPVGYLQEDRSGSASARNRGLEVARGELVAFTDDDVVVDRRWLVELMRGFEAKPGVACVTGLLLPAELDTPAQVWFEEYGGFSRGFARRVYDLGEHRPTGEPLYPYAAGIFGTGNSMAFRRSTLVEIGGFDPALGNGTPALGGVDSEVLLRAVVTGHRLVYEPAAVAYHVHRRDYAGLRRQVYSYGVGFAAYLLKTLMTNPHLLADFVGKLPRAMVFAVSPRSQRNASKGAGYPRRLGLLELWGIARGPAAYARSRRRYGRHPASPSPRRPPSRGSMSTTGGG